ncbi:MAG: ClbS/DfsB family four-helix bundle protein [Anaerolineae bacterium]|jgi:hypothetical protein|nr:ClbS/DfsB family four-helix bundle protein [Anaerolineae bacterium]
MSKAAILNQLAIEFELFETTLARIPRERLTEAQAIGAWSVKDLIAHLTYWNQDFIREVDAADRGESLEGIRDPRSDDEINAEAVAHSSAQSPETVIAAFEHSFQEIVSLIDQLEESALADDSALSAHLHGSFNGFIKNYVTDHWSEHREEIEHWILG